MDIEGELKSEISSKLKAAIKNRNLSKVEACRQLGIPREHLHRLLSGSVMPSLSVVVRMAELWGIHFEFGSGVPGRKNSRGQQILFDPNALEEMIERMDYSLQIFLCHASEDKVRVRELYRKLRFDGLEPWLDTEDLIPGQEWDQAIRTAVRKSDVVLVCLSKHSTQKSGYVQKEIAQALDIAEEKPERTIFIIPVLLEDCVIPSRLNKWQAVSISNSEGYEKLLLALRMKSEQLGHDITRLDRTIRNKVFERFERSGSFRSAEQNARDLWRWSPFSSKDMNRILNAACENGQIWCAAEVPEILEPIISKYGQLADQELLNKYREKVKHDV
ncbi:MAG TPA: TIR domain-containing protein [Candidatus Angelobacter sp.]|jgi:transcriptional regulator with XRE-family HTH domain|nr:TIR domain-containing protein [Candidatus Angelobacter sp.]